MYETHAERARAHYIGVAERGLTLGEAADLSVAPLVAYVNHGRWVVDCPDCGNGMYVHPDHLVWCCNCGNRSAGGMQRRVQWPAELERIEQVLLLRPTANRHWYPHETVADLVAESIANGAPVPFTVDGA